MTDYALARLNMVESQVRTNGVTDHRILDAMLRLPREKFLPQSAAAIAYADGDVALPGGRAELSPMMMGKLMQLAAIANHETILLVGAGLGYGAALAAALAGRVYALEQHGALASEVRRNLAGLTMVEVVKGPLAAGWAAAAPYDAIVVAGRVETVPEALFEQLAPGGRIVGIAGDSRLARLVRWTVAEDGQKSRLASFEGQAPRLPGFDAEKPAFVFG